MLKAHALSISLAALALSACGGAQSPIGTPGVIPQATPVAQSFHVAYKFVQRNEVANPLFGVTADGAGNLYGTSEYAAYGEVFELSPKEGTAGPPYLLHILHQFDSVPNDGGGPSSGLVRNDRGVFFGVTVYGGSCVTFTSGCGTVYSLTPSSSGYTESILYRFKCGASDGAAPLGTPIIGANGTLYGVAQGCGVHGLGTIFELVPTNGRYREHTIYSFEGQPDGGVPDAGLVSDSTGTLFGTTLVGGVHSHHQNHGVVYKLARSGGRFVESTIWRPTDGTPVGATVDPSGTLYVVGNGYRSGWVYSLTPTSGGYKPRLIHSFSGRADGYGSSSLLLLHGTFFGEMTYGGSGSRGLGNGLLYELVPHAGRYTERVLHNFSGPDGSFPEGGFVLVGSQLYGTTNEGGHPCVSQCLQFCVYGCGTVFKVSP